MGHSRASKADTHARLVAAAAARFKERGIDGISLADLMKELELTHGGFYKHFASRDELVTEALDLALAESGQAMRELLFDGDKPNIARFVDFYLSAAHARGRTGGCAVAALAGDVPRKSADVQAQFRKQIERNLEILVEALRRGSSPADGRATATDGPPTTAEARTTSAEARGTALLILSALYGSLMMARAVGDSPLSREVLRTVRKRILDLSGAVPRRRASR
jgi:TetR/AcrR family transcriptional repressor of nem operon